MRTPPLHMQYCTQRKKQYARCGKKNSKNQKFDTSTRLKPRHAPLEWRLSKSDTRLKPRHACKTGRRLKPQRMHRLRTQEVLSMFEQQRASCTSVRRLRICQIADHLWRRACVCCSSLLLDSPQAKSHRSASSKTGSWLPECSVHYLLLFVSGEIASSTKDQQRQSYKMSTLKTITISCSIHAAYVHTCRMKTK